MVLGSGPLASLIMPLIDSSPIEKQLRIGETAFSELRLTHARASPPWLRAWLVADGDRLGCALGELCAQLASARSTDAVDRGRGKLPLSASVGSLPSFAAILQPTALAGDVGGKRRAHGNAISRIVLLRGVPLFRDLLIMHVANLARRTRLRALKHLSLIHI